MCIYVLCHHLVDRWHIETGFTVTNATISLVSIHLLVDDMMASLFFFLIIQTDEPGGSETMWWSGLLVKS